MTDYYKLYDEDEVITVNFDGAPEQDYSYTTGVSTDTTVSKKIVYWFGADIGQVNLKGDYISYEEKDKIDQLMKHCTDNATYIYFEDGVYKFTCVPGTLSVRDIIGKEFEKKDEIGYEYTLSLQVLEIEDLEVTP